MTRASHVDAIAFVSASWFGVAAVAAAETPVAIGLSANGGLVEGFASPDGETWTLVIATPKGGVRAVIAGEAWDGRDTGGAGARGVRDPVSRRGTRPEREGSEGPAPAPGRIQPGQFLVFTL